MPWYRLEVHHGPGHQSGHRKGKPFDPEDFHFYEWTLGRTDLNETFDYLTRDLEYPVGKLRKVARLPVDVQAMKVKEFREKRRWLARRLAELKGMR